MSTQHLTINDRLAAVALRESRQSSVVSSRRVELEQAHAAQAASDEHILYIFADNQIIESDTPCYKFNLNDFLGKYDLEKSKKKNESKEQSRKVQEQFYEVAVCEILDEVSKKIARPSHVRKPRQRLVDRDSNLNV